MAIGGDKEAAGAIDKADSDMYRRDKYKASYLMNAEAEGQAIALVGRAIVRIDWPLKKAKLHL